MDAAVPQQDLKSRTQPQTSQDPAAWMRRRLRNPRTTRNVFTHAFDKSRRRHCATRCGPDGPHMNRNGHRRNGHRGARTMRAALSHVGPTMVEPHGCGGATTRPQAAHPTSDQPGPSRMDAASAAQPADHPKRVHARLRQEPPPALRNRCGPDGPHMNRNGHRRNGHRGARTMRAALSNVGPTMVEPHGCGGATTRPQAATPNLRPTRTQPHGCGGGCATPRTTRNVFAHAFDKSRRWPRNIRAAERSQDPSQGSPHDAGGSEPRRTGDGRAAWMRRRHNNASGRALDLRPIRTQPHGRGVAPPSNELPTRVRARPRRKPAPAPHPPPNNPGPVAPLPPNVICERPQRAPSRAR